MSLNTMKRYCGQLRRHVWLLLGILLITPPLSAGNVLIYVTNHGGDTVVVIDPVTNKVVQVIEGIKAAYAVDFSPDGSRVYISSESEKALLVLDQKTGEIIKKVPLSGEPNLIAVTKDGKRVFACIYEKPGGLDVIDTASFERLKSIPMKGALHDGYLTPDGKFVVVGSEEAKLLTVVDVQTEQPVWEVKFDNEVRPMAFEKGPDGSTRRIFVQLSFLHGFAVVDFATHKEVARIELPDVPESKILRSRADTVYFERTASHGIGVAPDGKTLWVDSYLANSVFVYSLTDLKLLGYARTGAGPDWITFTPDSKRVYVSDTRENTVSVIDAETLKEVARIPVGQWPKRSNTLVLP